MKLLASVCEMQDAMAAELVGIKKALAVMAAFLPMTESDVANAWEMATAQAGNAIEQGGTPPGMQPGELETIRVLLATAGMAWRGRSHTP